METINKEKHNLDGKFTFCVDFFCFLTFYEAIWTGLLMEEGVDFDQHMGLLRCRKEV